MTTCTTGSGSEKPTAAYVRELEADLNRAGAEIVELREALSFYAADKNWRRHHTPTGEAPSDAEVDRGKVARDALA